MRAVFLAGAVPFRVRGRAVFTAPSRGDIPAKPAERSGIPSNQKKEGTMKRLVAAAIIVACAGAAPPVAVAREEVEKLPGVIVTADRIEEDAKNVTKFVTVIPREEIEKNQYQDLGRMLGNYGVQVSGYSPTESFSQIAIRGMRTTLFGDDVTSPILVLIDGRRAGTTNVSMIPMVSIERIEIIRGPASVQYGASAVGGVVNVITKRGGENLKVSAEAGLGSWETWRTQAGISGTEGPFDFAGGISWMTADRDYKTGDGRRYRNTEMDYRTAYAMNTGLTFLEEHRLGLSLLGVRSEKMGNPGDINYNTLTPTTDRSNHSVDVTYDGGSKKHGLSWKTRYYSVSDRYLWEDPPTAFSRSKTEGNTQGTQAQLSFSKGFLTLTGGVDWSNNEYRVVGSSNSEYDSLGGFLLAKAAFFDEKLILSSGLRYDDYTLKYEGRERSLDNVAPSVGLAWHAMEWLTLRGNYGESYRVPAAKEVTGFSSPGWGPYPGFTYHGNSGLDPEKGKGWDAGFETAYKGFSFGLNYFQTDYENKIATRSYGSGSDRQYYNIDGTTKYRGIEGQAGYDLGEVFGWEFVLRPYASLTHLLKYEDETGRTLQNVRNTDLAYGVNFRYPSIGLEADLRFIYLGHQKETDFNSANYDELRTGGKTTADFFISKTIWNAEEAGTLSIKGEIRNLFDVNYETILGYPMPGRSYYIGLRYDY